MLLRHVARPMLASWFVYDGLQAALRPAEHVRAARSGVELVEKSAGIEAPLSEKQVATLVRAHGAATALAGLFLAVGKAPRGTLREFRPDDMAAVVLKEAVKRAGISPEKIQDVVLGCAIPEQEQGMNVARVASIDAGFPDTVSAATINRFISSS